MPCHSAAYRSRPKHKSEVGSFGVRASACLDWTEEASTTLEGETNALDRGKPKTRRLERLPSNAEKAAPHMHTSLPVAH